MSNVLMLDGVLTMSKQCPNCKGVDIDIIGVVNTKKYVGATVFLWCYWCKTCRHMSETSNIRSEIEKLWEVKDADIQ